MKLLVVILCYKVPDLTIDCLRSLEPEVTRRPGIHVALCENGTGGDVPQRLRQAIDKGYDVPLLHTVRGMGYVLREGPAA